MEHKHRSKKRRTLAHSHIHRWAKQLSFLEGEKVWQWPPRTLSSHEAPWSSGQSGPHPPPLSHSVSQLVSLREHEEREGGRERERMGGGHRVKPWPHQISPNWERCLAQVKTSNLKGIKCKCNDHMPTSNRHLTSTLSCSFSHTHTPFTCLRVGGY